MSNPIFNALGGGIPQGNNFMAQFMQFKKQMGDINPNEEINKLLQSGRINQNQLNQAQQMGQQIKQQMKEMFK